ncbi:MAG: DnaJ domain-containing protein [Micavibrio aeruginosavorus]|nr:DnaJ domain-containing protein [Micavibrio aeruginosavorus]
MPYALLALGLLVGFYGLYQFFLSASPKQMRTMVVTVVTGALALALFLLAVTGRLPVALAALSALWPVGLALYRQRMMRRARPAAAKTMTRDEALKILGLTEGASADDIHEAYKRLMLKVHPDQQGSAWMAAQLNAARDFLLEK